MRTESHIVCDNVSRSFMRFLLHMATSSKDDANEATDAPWNVGSTGKSSARRDTDRMVLYLENKRQEKEFDRIRDLENEAAYQKGRVDTIDKMLIESNRRHDSHVSEANLRADKMNDRITSLENVRAASAPILKIIVQIVFWAVGALAVAGLAIFSLFGQRQQQQQYDQHYAPPYINPSPPSSQGR